MEATLGMKIIAAVILDRDYRSVEECAAVTKACEQFCDYVSIHECKEIENFLLVPSAIDRAASQRLSERNKRSGESAIYTAVAEQLLSSIAAKQKSYVMSQVISERKRFERANGTSAHESDISKRAIDELESLWESPSKRLSLIPGKDALSTVNKELQNSIHLSVTPSAVIDAMKIEEILPSMNELLKMLQTFSTQKP
jgi:hypothetical protein